jgi:hypothetical protein
VTLGRAITVAVDGSPGDPPALAWAVEQAGPAGVPLVVAHAAGHLPPQMSYADRHVARRERRAVAQQVVERGATQVRCWAPGLEVRSAVRLVSWAALLPDLAAEASLIVASSVALDRAAAGPGGAPVLALTAGPVPGSTLLQLARAHGERHGLDVRTADVGGDDLLHRLRQLATEASLVLLPMPRSEGGDDGRGPSWPAVLDMLAGSPGPVVLVRDEVPRAGR